MIPSNNVIFFISVYRYWLIFTYRNLNDLSYWSTIFYFVKDNQYKKNLSKEFPMRHVYCLLSLLFLSMHDNVPRGILTFFYLFRGHYK